MMPTETNVHCFMVKTRATHETTETVLNNGWRLAVGGWRLAVGDPWGLSLTKKFGLLKDSPT